MDQMPASLCDTCSLFFPFFLSVKKIHAQWESLVQNLSALRRSMGAGLDWTPLGFCVGSQDTTHFRFIHSTIVSAVCVYMYSFLSSRMAGRLRPRIEPKVQLTFIYKTVWIWEIKKKKTGKIREGEEREREREKRILRRCLEREKRRRWWWRWW